jgi:hypothetical protein
MSEKQRRIEADEEAVANLRRRSELGWMLERGSDVKVTNPYGGTWTGRIIGLADHPAMLLEREDGVRVMLPQCFATEEIATNAVAEQEDQ